MRLTDSPDNELAALASQGEQMAFVILYERYSAGVGIFVSRFISVREEVEDVVIESFQKAFSKISTYNPEYKFSTWLYLIARNTALDHMDKTGRSISNMPVDPIDDCVSEVEVIADASGNPESAVISLQEYDKLVSAIESLSPLYRDVARMVLLDSFGYQEVADATGLPLNTVKTRVKRAKENVLKILSADSLK